MVMRLGTIRDGAEVSKQIDLIPDCEPDENARQDAGRLLEGCRQYLLMIANEVIGPELRAKFGASDLVQDTFLEAQRHLDVFRGQTKGELRAWLRRILECRLANIRPLVFGDRKTGSDSRGDDGAVCLRVGLEVRCSRVPLAITEQPRAKA